MMCRKKIACGAAAEVLIKIERGREEEGSIEQRVVLAELMYIETHFVGALSSLLLLLLLLVLLVNWSLERDILISP